MKCLTRPVLVLCVLLSMPAFTRAQFVKSDAIDFKSLLAPPPAPDSDQTKAELDQIIALQKSHTPTDPDVTRARREVNMTPFIYSDVLGSWFNPDDLPLTAKLLANVTKTASPIIGHAKAFFGRKRPFLIDPRITLLVDKEYAPSYPSGHSTRATVWALVLAEIFPDQKTALIARAHQIGDDRVLGGVHFPSDIQAGRTLAAAIFKPMLANPDFQSQLAAAKSECQSRVGVPAHH